MIQKLAQDGILPKVSMGGFICDPCAYPILPLTTESLGFPYMFTSASVADPRLFDPLVWTPKPTSLHWAGNRHLSMVGLHNATGHWENSND